MGKMAAHCHVKSTSEGAFVLQSAGWRQARPHTLHRASHLSSLGITPPPLHDCISLSRSSRLTAASKSLHMILAGFWSFAI